MCLISGLRWIIPVHLVIFALKENVCHMTKEEHINENKNEGN